MRAGDIDMKQNVNKQPACWRRRMATERALVLMAVVVAATAPSVAVPTLNPANHQQAAPPSVPGTTGGQSVKTAAGDPGVCLTPGCVHAASAMLKNMDLEADPCDDFYAFACGTFDKTTMIPDDMERVNVFSQISYQLTDELRLVVEKPLTDFEPKPFKLVKQLYRACMNKTQIAARGLEPIQKVLSALGGWPVLEGSRWNDTDFAWWRSVFTMRKMGYFGGHFLSLSVAPDFKNSSIRSIQLYQASFGLNREFLDKIVSNELVKSYYDYMVDVAILLGAEPKRAQYELLQSLSLEIALAKISLPREQMRNKTKLYNRMTIEEMQKKFPSIPWLEYFSNLLPPELNITDQEPIIVGMPTYITELEKLMSTTPKRVQANYALWHMVYASIPYLTEPLRDRHLKFLTALHGQKEYQPRWKECVNIVNKYLPLSVSSLYVREFFNEDTKEKTLEMVGMIREEIVRMLKEADWMDEKTRKAAIKKANAMAVHISYPEELLDDSKLEQYYQKLGVDESLFFESILNVNKFIIQDSFGRLRQMVNKTEWITHDSSRRVNALYNFIENSIEVPAGTLQGSFFNNERPMYMNYGAMGSIIGHEITHGFDQEGQQFDHDGNLENWWEPETEEKFNKKANCIVEQYGNFTDEETGLSLNGINTQGENIADNGGLKAAYNAYLQWASMHGPEATLPGLPLSPRQVFWVSMAQVWCEKNTPEGLRQMIMTNEHPPGRFRVLGSLSNSPEFSKDYNCPLGSKMNPPQKCQVW